ncbi:hypothetical protein BN946_scf184709.g4 [Trametes cinnabarina]|uniref:Asteroid domain-containing protein n=1 Tax=Pycnoporus cinnabarinus TaxID=5643 RepID=A0A060SQX0_PYCCI|nr:hypothetical protein BN946_scf184709.g4 [Trametes cinnabarina]
MFSPLAYAVLVETLIEMASERHSGNLHVHIADEEGDPYAVALAGRLNAYVAGRDSDFIVLNAEGYQGYIPLDEMVWTVTHEASTAHDGEGSVYSVDTEPDFDESGFQPARSKKTRKARSAPHQRTGRGILPPDDVDDANAQVSLSFTVYSPSTLASHLEIPVSLLPLLGALVGNDFTGSSDDLDSSVTTAEIRATRRGNLQRLFFERQLTLGQRIERVAKILREILAAAFGKGVTPNKKRIKKTIGSVMDLIDAAVTALLLRPLDSFATGEKEAIVERVVEATLQYALPRPEEDDSEDVDAVNEETNRGPLRWVSDVCPLHHPSACPLVLSLSRLLSSQQTDSTVALTSEPLETVRKEYARAYRQGHFHPHILDAVQNGTMWPVLFLEDPDRESVKRSVGRPIREWLYAILDCSVGLPVPPKSPDREEGEALEEDEDEDELVDVVEEDSEDDIDPLARLKGVLKELDGSIIGGESAEQEPPPSILSSPAAPTTSCPKVIAEYIRRGTRLASEDVTVTPISELLRRTALASPVDPKTSLPLPPPLWPDDLRRRLLVAAVDSDYPAVLNVPDDRLRAVLALRSVVRRMHLRAQENPGVKERQLERWSESEAQAFLISLFGNVQERDTTQEQQAAEVPIVERHIQLVAQLFAALEAIEQLTHVLLLSPRIANPARRFSGRTFHALLTGVATPVEDVDEHLWQACWVGLEDAYTTVPVKKGKKEKRAAAVRQATASAKTKKAAATKSGMFELLGDAMA